MLAALALQQHQHEEGGACLFHSAHIGVGPLTRWLALRIHGPGPEAKLGGGVQWCSRVPPVDVSGGTDRQGGGSGTHFAWVRLGLGSGC